MSQAAPAPPPDAGDPAGDPVLRGALAPITVWDVADGRFHLAWANLAATRGRGQDDELVGLGVEALIGGRLVAAGAAAAGAAVTALHRIVADGRPGSVLVPTDRPSGRMGWAEWTLTPVLDHAGRVVRYVVVHGDVTDRVRAEELVGHAGGGSTIDECWAAANAADAPLLLLRGDGTVSRVAPTAAALLGRSVAELLDADLVAAVVAAADRRAAARAVQRAVQGGFDGRGVVEVRLATRDGSERWAAWRALRRDGREDVPPSGRTAAPTLLCTVEDVTARRAAQARVEQVRDRDPATGLATGALLRQQTAAAVVRAARQHTGVAVCAVAVAGLLDPAGGHGIAGDSTGPTDDRTAVPSDRTAVLREVADRIRARVRDSDVVAHDGYGRFTVLLDGLGADADRVVRRVAGDLRAALARPHQVAGAPAFTRAVVSSALFPRDATEPGALLARAHRAVETTLRGRAGGPVR